MSADTNNFSVPSVVPVSVKQVDHNALEGSNKGDHRATANSIATVPQPAPRDETEQAGS